MNASLNCVTPKTPVSNTSLLPAPTVDHVSQSSRRLPYDRENTTMREFPLCGFCQKEYEDPANRRFHAQTVACPTCGPKAYLTTNTGELSQSQDPVREAGKLLSEGNVLAIKGYGGFHIAASTLREQPLERLRATKHRREKPFAIMARNLEAARVSPK